MSAVAVVLPAAGRSSRFAGRDKKPFTNLDGRAVWLRTAELFVGRPDVKQILVVVSPEDREQFDRRYAANVAFMGVTVVAGGSERFESVANALAALRDDIDLVAVHDAVRPCTPPAVIDAAFRAAAERGAAVPAVPVGDTLKRAGADHRVEATVPRANLWLAQTPQTFRRDWLVGAYAKRTSLAAAITDDAQLVEAAGHPVYVVAGSPLNLKITTQDDLKIAASLLALREAEVKKGSYHPFADERFL